MEYRTEIKGVLKYSKMITVEDEKGNLTEIHDTAGIEVAHRFKADTHTEAKKLLKEWVTEQIKNRNAIGFEGTVSAWVITEEQLLDEAPFNVEITVNNNILVDF